MADHLQLIALPSPLRLDPFDLTSALMEGYTTAQTAPTNGDIVVISSKFAAIAEGRVVTLADVTPSQAAYRLAQQYRLSPQMAELVLQESDHIFGGIPGFLLSVKDDLIAPNAGIDSSNVPAHQVVLYPRDSFVTAEGVRAALQERAGVQVGVVLSDSRLMPGRTGTTGVALGVAGFVPVVDERGQPDLLGNPLQVSQRAVADNLCAAAELLMGEADEGIPMVVTRHTGISLTGARRYSMADLSIDYRQDIYVAIMGGEPPAL